MHAFSLVSLSDFERSGFPATLRSILRDDFLLVEGHGASQQQIDDAEGLTERLFTEWSEEELEERYGRPDIYRQRGLTPKISLEQAEALPGQPRPPADLKVFGMFRHEDWPKDMVVDAPYGPNVWPDELLPEFRPTVTGVMNAQYLVYMTVLAGLEDAYGLPSGKLTEMARGAESIARTIFYPGLDLLERRGVIITDGAQGSGPHGDINAATVLRLNDGLWVRREGVWQKVDTSHRSAFGVNVGEMIAKVEGIDDDLVPTIHCVGAPPGVEDPSDLLLRRRPRCALPFFGHFRHSTWLRPGLQTGVWFKERIAKITQG